MMFDCTRWRRPSTYLSVLIFTLLLSGCTVEGLPIDVEATVEVAVEATLTAVSETGTEPGSTETAGEVAEVATSEPNSTPIPLITPTPDRSGEVMAAILERTRHLKGGPNAKVALVEFSDFM